MTTIQTKVVSIESLTPYVLKLVLDAQQNVSFKAGQYLQVVMSEQDKRPFSIANIPANDGLLELHIGATPENPYAYEVVQQAKENKTLTLEVGLGQAFRRNSKLEAVLIAGGTGYSYTKSILLDMLHAEPQRKVSLYWGAKTYEDLYEADLLHGLAATNPLFNFVPVVEKTELDWAGKTGLVHEAVLKDYVTLNNQHVYVAGRFEMAGVVKDAFLPLGLKPENLFGDAYAFL